LNSITDLLLSVSENDEFLRGERVIILSKLLVSKYGWEKFRCRKCGALPEIGSRLVVKYNPNSHYYDLECWRKIHY
jgi:hypothetical protein